MTVKQTSVVPIGLVVIGRNEGDRLRNCLLSVVKRAQKVVYVDSGSTDGSADTARAIGVEVVELDMTNGFTAARARNKGFSHLRDMAPELAYVQFVDGDCEVMPDWLERAAQFLDVHHEVEIGRAHV